MDFYRPAKDTDRKCECSFFFSWADKNSFTALCPFYYLTKVIVVVNQNNNDVGQPATSEAFRAGELVYPGLGLSPDRLLLEYQVLGS